MFQQRLALVRYESGDGKTFDFVSVSLVSSVLLLEFFVWNNSESSIECNIGPMFFKAPRFAGIMSCFSSYQQKHEKCHQSGVIQVRYSMHSGSSNVNRSMQLRYHAINFSSVPYLGYCGIWWMPGRYPMDGWYVFIHSFIDFIQLTNFIGIFIRMSLKSTQ